MKTVVLIGMSGTGKTSVAKLFAKNYNVEFFDSDKKIEELEQMTISQIFEIKGENYFRQKEKEIIKNYLQSENMIVSIGGGAFQNFDTRELLLNTCNVIYLKTSPEIIYQRIKNDLSRPLLCGKMSVEKITEMINLREKNYLLAHKTINTDNKTLQEIVMELK